MAAPFDFLKAEFQREHDAAIKACTYGLSDTRAACFNSRVALKSSVKWAFEHDSALPRA